MSLTFSMGDVDSEEEGSPMARAEFTGAGTQLCDAARLLNCSKAASAVMTRKRPRSVVRSSSRADSHAAAVVEMPLVLQGDDAETATFTSLYNKELFGAAAGGSVAATAARTCLQRGS